MTPAKNAQSLIKACRDARVVMLDAGHSVMTEAPDALLDAMKTFLKP